jgi:hypothetical protein
MLEQVGLAYPPAAIKQSELRSASRKQLAQFSPLRVAVDKGRLRRIACFFQGGRILLRLRPNTVTTVYGYDDNSICA